MVGDGWIDDDRRSPVIRGGQRRSGGRERDRQRWSPGRLQRNNHPGSPIALAPLRLLRLHLLHNVTNVPSPFPSLQGCNVITMEIEHVSVPALATLESQGVTVRPSSNTIRIIQDKYVQKDHFARNGVALGRYMDCPGKEDVRKAIELFGLPLMLKSRKEVRQLLTSTIELTHSICSTITQPNKNILQGYDGRGNAVVRTLSDVDSKFDELYNAGKSGGVYCEGWVDFVDELAVMVVKGANGDVKSYPTVTAIQRDSVCRVVVAPARCSRKARLKAEEVARKAISSLGDGAVGIFGVELFLTREGDVLLNEVAPRPHNTGHYTQDACAVSQFENHLRAVAGMELGDTSMCVGAAAMVNVLGCGEMGETLKVNDLALGMERATVHWYGKSPAKKGRKMGHVNVTADSESELQVRMRMRMKMRHTE